VTPCADEGLQLLGPGGLAVVVGVNVDEAGGDQQAAGVDLFRGRAGQRADGGDAAVFDRHVGHAGGRAQAVVHRAAAQDQVEISHGVSLGVLVIR